MRFYRSTVATLLLALTSTAAFADNTCPDYEVFIASCQIEGQDKGVLLCMEDDHAIYRFGSLQGAPELTLRSPLIDLFFLYGDKTGLTEGEAVVFQNDDTSYRVTFGYRPGEPPSESSISDSLIHEEWIKTGSIDVLRDGKTIAGLTCADGTVERKPEFLLSAMQSLGRATASDGEPLVRLADRVAAPAAELAPCEAETNVDTCWLRGVAAENRGDLAGAVAHFDMSCDARLMTGGCYDAGKIYLQNKELRDYDRAYGRFSQSCGGDVIGEAPYACKYLGWMHQTGIGADEDPEKAWQLLRRACFPYIEGEMNLFVDSEGCHFLSKAALMPNTTIFASYQSGPYMAYLALVMGCAEGAEGICEEAKAFFASETAALAPWIAECDSYGSCASLTEPPTDYDAQQAFMREIFIRFDTAQMDPNLP